MNLDGYFTQFWPLLKRVLFFEAAGAGVEAGSSPKTNHQF